MAKSGKSLPRIFLDLTSTEPNKQIALDEQHSKHLSTVLRLKTDYLLEVVDKQSNQLFLAKVTKENPFTIVLTEAINNQTTENQPEVTLLMALCKADKNELVLEKCTELGVDKFIFIETKHSVAKLSPNKIKRLDKVAESATAQSKQLRIPEVHYFAEDVFRKLKDTINSNPDALKLICSLEADSKKLNQLSSNNQILVAVGPEGDFSEEEYLFFKEQGFKPISLGTNVLRSETAAIAICSKLLI